MPQALSEATHRSAPPHIVLCGCGPGELMGWALPFMDAAAAEAEPGKIRRFSLLVWPRLLPSRRVAEVARASGRFQTVLDSTSALRLVAGGQPPKDWRRLPPSLVLHLGGTPALSLRLAARLGCPVAAYVERPPPRTDRFARIFCATAVACGSGGPSESAVDRVLHVGDLLVDAVAGLRARRTRGAAEASVGPVVAFFPGSRNLQLRHSLPRIPVVAMAVARRLPNVRFLIARSPFVTRAMLVGALDFGQKGPGAARILETAEGTALAPGQGPHIPIVPREDALHRADLLVCTPGTSTAEAAALGIPMLVVAPFGPEIPIFSGLAGLVERTPGVGAIMKRMLLHRMAAGMRYYAYPNIRAQKEIVPELQGPVDLVRIEDSIVELLENEESRTLMADQLLELMGPPGAAQRLLAGLESCLPRVPTEQ